MERFFAVFATLCVLSLSTNVVHAQDSASNASAASAMASEATIFGLAASGQAAVGLSAAPMIISGTATSAVGSASTQAGLASAAAASGRPGPLPLTEETITVISPAQALKQARDPNAR